MPSASREMSPRERLMADLVACLREVVRQPSTAADRLLSEACERVGAHAGRLLVLSAETGVLDVMAERAPGGAAFGRRLSSRGERPGTDCPSSMQIERLDDYLFITAPAIQDDIVVAAIEVLTPAADEHAIDILVTIASLLPLVRSNLTFREGLQLVPPIPDVSGDESSFRRRVSEYLDSHTRAALVCVYVVDTDLDVSIIYAPEHVQRSSFVESPGTYELLREAALEPGRSRVVERDPEPGEAAPWIRSFLLIACAGTRRIDARPDELVESYVLLVGFPMRYTPCEAEVAVLEQLLALAAYLHQVYSYLHEIVDRVGHVAEIGSAITGLEVSQKARHDAKNQIELAQHLIAQIGDRPAKSKELLEQMSLLLLRVADDLDEMKRATRAPEKERVPTSLRDMWDTACAQVRWRMGKRKVKLSYDGRDVQVLAAPDWFRQVFLNLLLNSADAFDTADRRAGRIVLKINPMAPGADRVVMTYSDDATGILPQHFLSCDVAEDVDLPERVFLPGVTSKAGGSGWGLYVCRSIIRAHRGSIDLDRAKSGTVFSISIPTAGTST